MANLAITQQAGVTALATLQKEFAITAVTAHSGLLI